MSDKQDEAQDQEQEQAPSVDAGRRDFIRKASYTAPALIALGAAAHSRRAQGQFTGPPSAPEGGNSAPDDDQLLEDLENSENN